MKTKIMGMITIGFFCTAFVLLVNSAEATITDVHILPEEPTIYDVITIVTSGVEGSGAVLIDSSNFDRVGTSLQLDIFLDVGVFQVITPWSHSEDIGTLPVGLYELTVQTLEQGVVTDTYSTSFEVVPEPTTILLLGLGVIGIRISKRTSSR
jgi:hypothetical protein